MGINVNQKCKCQDKKVMEQVKNIQLFTENLKHNN